MFCRECGGSIEDDSKFCRLCGKAQVDHAAQSAAAAESEAPAETSPPQQFQTWAIVAVIAMILFVFLAVAVAMSGSQPASSTNLTDLSLPKDVATDPNANAATSPSPPEADANWSYRTDTDKVRGGSTYFASTTSTNTIRQNPPYDSDTSMTMTVRRTPGAGLNILLTISSGQMMCPSYEGCSGTVRFDDGPAERVSFAGPDDNNSETVFVEGEKAFLAKLRRSKRLIVEKTLYEAGAPQFEFDVHGLKWDH